MKGILKEDVKGGLKGKGGFEPYPSRYHLVVLFSLISVGIITRVPYLNVERLQTGALEAVSDSKLTHTWWAGWVCGGWRVGLDRLTIFEGFAKVGIFFFFLPPPPIFSSHILYTLSFF